MPRPASPRREVAIQANRAVVERQREFKSQLDEFSGNLADALPRHVTLKKFKQVASTAVAYNPDLLRADRRTLFNALLKCASDGLMPDGREAALVVYNTEVKARNPQTGLDERFRTDVVQYMPMISGIRERMRRTGQVASAEAHVVHSNDTFHYTLGDSATIEHVPPALGHKRGPVVGAYAIIKLKNGEVLRDVMSIEEIEVTRSVSRAAHGPMWTKFYDEAARKTVLRRCAKAAPQAADIESLLERDDEPVALPEASDFTTLDRIEPEPQRHEVIDYPETRYAAAEPVEAPGEPDALDELLEATAEEPPTAAPQTPPEVPFPGDEPSSEPKLRIQVPQRRNKPDYRTWALGLLIPQIRLAASTTELGLLLGDNEESINEAKRQLSAVDVRELEASISERWDEIDAMEKEPA